MNNQFVFKKNKIAFLFAALSVAVVLIQTSRFWDLVDLSYVLDYSYRISLGQMPYKDFFFLYPPGTFLIQALIIKFFGTTLYPQIIYCSVISFLTYLLTYRILFFINDDKWLNIVLALPISITGGYGIMSQPFYDPDSVFIILLTLFIVLKSYSNKFSTLYTFFAGIICVLPTFIKQNTGLAFLMLIHATYLGTLIFSRNELTLKKYKWFIFGTLISLSTILIYIHFAYGLGNYINNTITIAYKVRLPEPFHFLSTTFSLVVLRKSVFWILIVFILKYLKLKNIWLNIISLLLLLSQTYLIPFAYYLFRGIPYFDTFLTIWNITIVVGSVIFIYSLIKIKSIPLFIKLLLGVNIGLIGSSLLSQGSIGSTYGIWPIFSLVFALMYLLLLKSGFKRHPILLKNLILVNFIVVTFSVIFYVISNDRWIYYNGFDNTQQIHSSNTQRLRGLSLSGDATLNMDNLFEFVQKEIPLDDAIIMIPHEDPFYFATGRKLLFPILNVDWQIYWLVYKPQDIIDNIELYNVKWLIVKTRTQMIDLSNTKEFNAIYPLLKNKFVIYRILPGYEIYKR